MWLSNVNKNQASTLKNQLGTCTQRNRPLKPNTVGLTCTWSLILGRRCTWHRWSTASRSGRRRWRTLWRRPRSFSLRSRRCRSRRTCRWDPRRSLRSGRAGTCTPVNGKVGQAGHKQCCWDDSIKVIQLVITDYSLKKIQNKSFPKYFRYIVRLFSN